MLTPIHTVLGNEDYCLLLFYGVIDVLQAERCTPCLVEIDGSKYHHQATNDGYLPFGCTKHQCLSINLPLTTYLCAISLNITDNVSRLGVSNYTVF